MGIIQGLILILGRGGYGHLSGSFLLWRRRGIVWFGGQGVSGKGCGFGWTGLVVQGGCSEDFARDPLVLSHDPHLSLFILRFLGVFWDRGETCLLWNGDRVGFEWNFSRGPLDLGLGSR